MKTGRISLTLLALFTLAGVAAADVKLPSIFGEHMVLQRDMKLPVWGWASPGEKVSVQMDGGAAATATADGAGNWRVELPAMPAGGTHTLTIQGKNTVKIGDILVGEVWLCSGQSNMEFVVASSINAQEEIAAANFPEIRHIQAPKVPASEPQPNFPAEWKVCSPATVGGFTACGYYMARKLHQDLGVPIGLINSSWGGTRIEPWVPVSGFANLPKLADIYNQVQLSLPTHPQHQALLKKHLEDVANWEAATRAALASGNREAITPAYPDALKPLTSHQSPTTLFNGMVNSFVGFPIRGAIWYQGESNHGEGMLYTEKMKALINGWRDLWGYEFPFYYVMIAPYHYGEEQPTVLAEFWEAQAAALEIPKTGMVVPTDIGNYQDIHPRNKQEVGRRFALLALKNDYGKTDLAANSPSFASLKQDGDSLRVTFKDTAGGLKSNDGKPLTWFEIIGPDTDFTKADAKIEGDTVILTAKGVSAPAAVRFAWNKQAEANLVNGAGLPAIPFRAGKVPTIDYLNLKVDEAKDYRLLYDLDLAKLGGGFKYDVDNSKSISGKFDRVAYFLELKDSGGPTRYCYVSMDAFSGDASKLGVPTYESGAVFQMNVKNAHVISNVKGLEGTFAEGCNIEFWPHNYGQGNYAKVPGASDSIYDFGDQMFDPVNGYGSMQIHNFKAKQTLLAVNHWNAGSGADLGIGNSPGNNTADSRDWTFSGNAGSYTVKRLRVLVHLK